VNDRRSPALCSLVAALCSVGFLCAQEATPAGKMWLLEEPPVEHVRAAYGLELTPEWLERTRLSGLRYGGGTASFVSPRGLMLTNHHVVRGDLARMEKNGQSLGVSGWVARSREEELPIPGASARQLVAVEDVTAEIFDGLDLAGPPEEVRAELGRRRNQVQARVRAKDPTLTVELVSLYRGARVHAYSYRTYADVRLVFAPELGLGYFGGETDNFRYPRYALDFALCRVYDKDAPLDSSAFCFTWSRGGAGEGDAVFTLGNPGSTDRLLTVAELEYRRDSLYPAQTAITADLVAALQVYAKAHPDQEDSLRELAFGLANADKSLLGKLSGLRDEGRMAARRAVEADLRARLARDPVLEPLGNAWEEIDLALEELVEVYRRWWYRSPWYGEGRWFRPLARAVSLVEDLHPDFLDEDRVPFASTGLRYPFEPEVFAAHLAKARTVLGADDPVVQALLQGREPLEAVQALLAGTRIDSPEFVEELRAGGWDALEASDDPALVVARAMYPLLVEASDEKRLLEEVIAHNGLLVGRAIDALEGPLVPPEATFSQRLSAGRVLGYTLDGQAIPAWTRFAGLYERCAQFGDQGEFDLPDLWFERKDELDLETPMNFVCTVDSTGGSSGSPVFDKERRIVGVLFDGNEQGTENQFVYQDGAARGVVVHSEAILEALRVVYGAPELVAELTGEPAAR